MRHREKGPLLYDYLEETSLGAEPVFAGETSKRRVTEPLSVIDHRLSARYAWWKANYLEGCVEADASSGVWPISDCAWDDFSDASVNIFAPKALVREVRRRMSTS